MRVAVSGATGYLGSRIARHLERGGHSVHALVRRHGSTQFPRIEFDLEGRIPDAAEFSSRRIDALIHCAYSFSARTAEDSRRINVHGSTMLFESALSGGLSRIINVSTMSAFSGCRSIYGRSKLAIEAAAKKAGGISIRPGLIFGESAGGMMGSLERFVRSNLLIPLIGGGRNKLYLIYDEDLVEIIANLTLSATLPELRVIACASPAAMTMREILETIASRNGLARVLVPVPWMLAWMGMRMLERTSLQLTFRSDSIVGLVFSDPVPGIQREVLERLRKGQLRSFASG